MGNFSFVGQFITDAANSTPAQERFLGNTLDEDKWRRLVSILDIGDESSVIPDGFFRGCPNLKTANIPGTIKRIGKHAFAGCGNLCRVDLPDSLEVIGDGSFDGCISMEDLLTEGSCEFPSSLELIGKFAFRNTALSYVELGFKTSIIGEGAFSGCKKLSFVGLYRDVESVGDFAFEGCTALVEVEIKESVHYLPSTAFQNCTSLPAEDMPAPRVPQDFPDPGPLTYTAFEGYLRPNFSPLISFALSAAPYWDFLDGLKKSMEYPYFFRELMDYVRIEAWNGITRIGLRMSPITQGEEFDYIRTQDLYDVLTKTGGISNYL